MEMRAFPRHAIHSEDPANLKADLQDPRHKEGPGLPAQEHSRWTILAVCMQAPCFPIYLSITAVDPSVLFFCGLQPSVQEDDCRKRHCAEAFSTHGFCLCWNDLQPPPRINHCVSGKCQAEHAPPRTQPPIGSQMSAWGGGCCWLQRPLMHPGWAQKAKSLPFGTQSGREDKTCQCDRSETSRSHPAVILGALPEGSLHFWSILNPLLLSECPSPPFYPPSQLMLHSACSWKEIGRT